MFSLSRIGIAAVVAIVIVAVVASGVMRPASTVVKCAQFSSQREAQEALGGHPELDRDVDGLACESLP